MSQKTAKELDSFLDRYEISISHFAKISRISRPTVYTYLAGGNPNARLRKKIEKNFKNYFKTKGIKYFGIFSSEPFENKIGDPHKK